VKRLTLRELIPAAIVFVFLGAAAALILELLVAAAAGRAADSGATSGLLGFLGICVPALVALYRQDSKPPKTGEEEAEREEVTRKARQVLTDYLERTRRIVGWVPKWRLSA